MRIFGFEDFVQLHCVGMVEASHHLDFLNQTLFPILLTVCGLLRKGFHRIILAIFQLLSQVDGGEISFADLPDGLELLVEAPLVYFSFQHISPLLQIRCLKKIV